MSRSLCQQRTLVSTARIMKNWFRTNMNNRNYVVATGDMFWNQIEMSYLHRVICRLGISSFESSIFQGIHEVCFTCP